MQHHMVEIEAESAQRAAEVALELAHRDPEYFRTGHSSAISSIFINDSECSKYAPYVAEIRPGERL